MKMSNINSDPMGEPVPNPPKSKFVQRRDDPPSRRLSVKIRRHYGAVDVEFGIEADGNPENQADQERLFSMLELQVSDMHDLYAKDRLPKVPGLQLEKARDDSIVRLAASAIIRNERGQWRLLTASGTKYSKYGAMFNEAELPAGLSFEMDNAIKSGRNSFPIIGYDVKVSGGIVQEFCERV